MMSDETADLLSKVDICVVSNGFDQTPKSFVIRTNRKNYLFNCGEGVQRIIGERRLKVHKFENVFITRKSWANLGGFIGFSLTLNGFANSITLHSPCGVDKLMKEATFANFKSFHVKRFNYEVNKSFDDNILNVRPIELKLNDAKTDSYGETAKKQEFNSLLESVFSENEETDEDEIKEPDEKRLCKENIIENNKDAVYSYMIRIKKGLAKLNESKLTEFQVPNTRLRGLLKSGIDVTLPDGRIIRAIDVLDQTDCTESNVLVLDLPNIQYLQQLKENEVYLNDRNKLNLIIHLSNNDVLVSKEYNEWIDTLSVNCEHLILDETFESVHSMKIYKTQKLLNYIDSNIFPLLTNMDEVDPKDRHQIIKADNKIFAIAGLEYSFRPTRELVLKNCNKHVTNKDVFEELKTEKMVEFESFDKDLRKVQEEVNSIRKGVESASGTYPRIAFLGTGSSVPSVMRNVSGVLVEIDENTNVLLDCGEGTLGQLRRLYKDNYENTLKNIKAIFISHHHADHHLGLFSIVLKRKLVFDKLGIDYEKLYLFLPYDLVKWVNTFKNEFDSNLSTYF